MENIIEFIGNNYSWFLTVTIILLFALIGYIYDSKKEKNDLFTKNEKELAEESLENLIIPDDKMLSEVVNKSKNINAETKSIELVDDSLLSDNIQVENIDDN